MDEIHLVEDEGMREFSVATSMLADGVNGSTELDQVLLLITIKLLCLQVSLSFQWHELTLPWDRP